MEAASRTRVLTGEFFLVCTATFAAFFAFGIIVLALPLYVRDELGRSDVGVGFAIGAASIGAIVAGFVIGDGRFARAWLVGVVGAALAAAAAYRVGETRPDEDEAAPRGWL